MRPSIHSAVFFDAPPASGPSGQAERTQSETEVDLKSADRAEAHQVFFDAL